MRILGLGNRSVEVGGEAGLTVFSESRRVVVGASKFRFLSRNTPCGGMTLNGVQMMTLVAGKVVRSEA